jgi:hypothetical protein
MPLVGMSDGSEYRYVAMQDESHALEDVRARLVGRFPDLDADTVNAAVDAAHAQLTGPIRDYVPLLVERAARDLLSRRHEAAAAQ